MHTKTWHRSGGSRVAALLVITAVLFAACSSSPSTPSASQSRSAIKHAYSVLFNFSNKSVNAKVAVVDQGTKLKSAIGAALASPLAKEAVGADVTSIKLLSQSQCSSASLAYPCAKVGYAIIGPHNAPLLPGATGYATYVNDKWLVSSQTICGLISLMSQGHGATPQGC